jgi:hypothetical protein
MVKSGAFSAAFFALSTCAALKRRFPRDAI